MSHCGYVLALHHVGKQHFVCPRPLTVFSPEEERSSLFFTAQNTKNIHLWALPGVLCDGKEIWTSTYMDVRPAC